MSIPAIMRTHLSSPFLDPLNPEQRKAVETLQGPVLVLAGAGTGKTRVLTSRIAHLLSTGGASPHEILSVTFTNKAATEMRERVSSLLNRPTEGMWLGTFHSLCVRILRRYGENLGFTSNFTILDTDDQERLLKQILKALDVDSQKHTARALGAVIGRWKDQGLSPTQVKERAGEDLFAVIYETYQERLRILNAMDFGDLILHCLTLFTKFPDILEKYQNQFRYILVDEYQDTNISQYLWLRLLAQKHRNLCCVGDDDQSIYGWRGAEVGNILKFEKDFPDAIVIRLEQNYRSTTHILGAASSLIAHNEGRLGKTLWTEYEGGEKVIVRGTWDSVDEARVIAEAVEDVQRMGERLSQMAILVRAGFQTRELEDRFLTMGIPHRVIGGQRFYERMEIRDAIAYIRLVVQPHDGLAFERIINVPRRGIGTATLQSIHQYARESQLSLPSAARVLVDQEEIRGKTRQTLTNFFLSLDRWRGHLATHESPSDLVKIILEESGYIDYWRQDKSAEAPGRLENLKELMRALDEFPSLHEFLEHVSLVLDNNLHHQDDVVTIMTLHAAKGLEFDTVFLSGWEEGLFPHARSLEENGTQGLEEERRLAYVGLTRARKRAIVSYCLHRRMHQGWQHTIPSRFIKELDKDHILYIQPNGNQASVSSSSTPSRRPPYEVVHMEPIICPYKVGDKVFHEKFGYGVVEDFDGDRVDVNFRHSGMKRVMASFLKLASQR